MTWWPSESLNLIAWSLWEELQKFQQDPTRHPQTPPPSIPMAHFACLDNKIDSNDLIAHLFLLPALSLSPVSLPKALITIGAWLIIGPNRGKETKSGKKTHVTKRASCLSNNDFRELVNDSWEAGNNFLLDKFAQFTCSNCRVCRRDAGRASFCAFSEAGNSNQGCRHPLAILLLLAFCRPHTHCDTIFEKLVSVSCRRPVIRAVWYPNWGIFLI